MHPARLPENVYVADASLFPKALGNPPILTIVAMAKRIATLCAEHVTRPTHHPLPGEDQWSFMSREDRPRFSPAAPSRLNGRTVFVTR